MPSVTVVVFSICIILYGIYLVWLYGALEDTINTESDGKNKCCGDECDEKDE